MLIELVPVRPPAASGQRYRAVVDGRELCVSRTPFFAAARVLLGEGVPPETVLEAKHKGSDVVAMRSTVGEAAKWTIEESSSGRAMRKRLWAARPDDIEEKPHDAPSGGEGRP